jgi:hypothetical protein
MHPKGKITDASVGGRIEQLVKKGYLVAAPDVIGTGETEDGNLFYPMYVSFLIGRSIVGIQAGDIGRVVNFLQSRKDVDYNKISGIAFNEMCPTLLHAAAMNNNISSIALIGSLISYRTVVMNRFYEVRLSSNIRPGSNPFSGGLPYSNNTVAGALTAYDLPDLIGCIAPRKIVLVDLKDQMKQSAPVELINDELSFPRSVYSLKKVPKNINIIPPTEDLSSIIGWCFE